MKEPIHKNLAEGKWFTLSLAEQMGNIGSEVSRVSKQQGKDQNLFHKATDRALELFDLTLSDNRWQRQHRLKEIGRAREVFCDALLGGKEYNSTFESLQKYFDHFGLVARLKI